MSLFKPLRMSKAIGNRFGFTRSAALVALVLAFTAIEGLASTGSSSWGSPPAWSAPEASSSSRKLPYAREGRYAPPSPFAPGSNNLAIDVGQVFLMGTLSSNYNDAIGAQIHYTYGVSELFGFDSSVGYSDHSDGRFSVATLLTGLRTNLAWYDKVVPYFVFGLGFYRPTYTDMASPLGDSYSPLLFGVHLGPGVDLELTRQLFFGAGLTFHDVFGNTKVLPSGTRIDAGGTYTSFLLHAGVTF
jgi:hypothetical protein